MDGYILDEELANRLRFSDEAEHAELLEQARLSNERIAGNLDRVSGLLAALLEKLASIGNLPDQLACSYPQDHLNIKYYFSDFQLDKGAGYIRNNFGRDLRHLQTFVNHAKSLGSQTVFSH